MEVHPFVTSLQARWYCPGWYVKYTERVKRAAVGKAERDGGLNKGDVLLVVLYAHDIGLLKGGHQRGYRSRTSAQLRGALRSRVVDILEKLNLYHYSRNNPGFLRLRPPTRSRSSV